MDELLLVVVLGAPEKGNRSPRAIQIIKQYEGYVLVEIWAVLNGISVFHPVVVAKVIQLTRM